MKTEKKENEKDVNDLLNKDIEPLNIEEKEEREKIMESKTMKEYQEKLIEKTFSLNYSDASSVKTSLSGTQGSLTSENFNEEKDIDLPNFTSTKYASLSWRVAHFIFYLFYNVTLMISTCEWYLRKFDSFNTFLILSHFCYFFSSLMLWLYYKRGCLTDANLNTKLKKNVDHSLKAKILRSEIGWIYFFALIGAVILLYGNFFFIFIEEDKITTEFWNINLVGTMVISVTQIFKIDKTLTENKEYVIKNDIARSLVEIFLFFGSLFFGTSYLLQNMYDFNEKYFFIFLAVLKFFGNILIIFSGITLFYRYFFGTYKDLNVSNLSNISY